jgi:hypothetical protein
LVNPVPPIREVYCSSHRAIPSKWYRDNRSIDSGGWVFRKHLSKVEKGKKGEGEPAELSTTGEALRVEPR